MALSNVDVCISAGHGLSSQTAGRRDSGMDSKYILDEAAVTFAFSRDVAYNLAAAGVKVLFRDRGPYNKADDDAAAWDAERFVEFHLNAGGGKGSEVFCDASQDLGDTRLAKRILAALVKNGFTNRGVKYRDFAVVKDHPGMVSCLVELFFGDSSTDVSLFKARRNAILLSVLNAILVDLGRSPYKRLPASTAAGKARLWSKKYYHWI